MIGSVFSPYYAWSGRENPENHIGLNVGLYGKGIKRWTLTERGTRDLVQEQHYLKIGPSDLQWDGNALIITINEWANPIFRKVEGTIKLFPETIIETPFNLDGNANHFWQPLGAISRAEVSFAKPNLNWKGKAYIDSNWGNEPLENGFRYWDWSRAHTNDGAGVLYDAFTRGGENRQLALNIHKNGSIEHLPAPKRQKLNKAPIWRVERSTLYDDGGPPKTLQMLEDTPFYTRSHIDTSFNQERVIAVHESLDLDRFSKNWVRRLLPFRMPRWAS